MDHQNVAIIAGIAVGVAVIAYIIWGPSHQQKPRRGYPSGLVNLGSTCFLNTLLQALASCAHLVEWLDHQTCEEKPLTAALHEVLWILNGQSETDTHSPELVLKVLRRHGWVMPAGEHDAHELFHCIVSTLQEENRKPRKGGSLSDALAPSDTLSQASDILEEDLFEIVAPDDAGLGPRVGEDDSSSSKGTSEIDFCEDAPDNVSNAPPIRPEFDIPGSKVTSVTTSVYEDVSSRGDSERFFSIDSQTSTDSSGTLKVQSSRRLDEDALRRGVLDRSGTSPPPCNNIEVPPFTGLLASSLTCCKCSNASSVRTDTFDSISLTFGDVSLPLRRSLADLIRQFVRTEIVPDVHCDKCQTITSSYKTYNFGKLPPCLCFHVVRTAWHAPSHTSSKRDDHVDFPEYLVMDPFTWRPGASPPPPAPPAVTARHLYRLKSVVVHVGGATSGHFLTHRRGPICTTRRHVVAGKTQYEDNERWYVASDENVSIASMSQAMDSMAYMLFYEKCSADIRATILAEQNAQ